MPPAIKHFSWDTEAEIEKLWECTTLSSAQIAKKFGVTKNTILGIAHRRGWKPRKKPKHEIRTMSQRLDAMHAKLDRLLEECKGIGRITIPLIILWIFGGTAWAQGGACLDLTYTWTTPYQTGTVQAVSYSVTAQYLSVLFFTQDLNVYQNVPLSIAQRATGSNVNGDKFYNTYIKGKYDQALLAQETGCPLLAEETGAFLLANQR